MASLRTRNGWYYLDVVSNGLRKIIALGTKDKKLAEQIKRKIEADITLRRFDLSSIVKKDVTVVEFFRLYLEFGASYKKPATIRNEKQYTRILAEIVGGNSPVRSINTEQVDRWQAKILAEYSPSTFNIMWRSLHAAFNVARRWGYRDDNPFDKVARVKVDEMRRYLTVQELKKIIDLLDSDITDARKKHLRQFYVKLRLLIEFLLLTGMRRQEALSLTQSRIDLQNELIFLENTKGKTFRTVPMHPRVKAIITQLGEGLFSGLRPSSVSHRFAKLVKRTGLPAGFKLHSLRHTFATNLVTKGIDIAVIQNLLGHSDIRTTLIYGKTTMEKMKRDIQVLDHL